MLTDDYHRPIGMNLTDWKIRSTNNTGFSKEKMGPTANAKTTLPNKKNNYKVQVRSAWRVIVLLCYNEKL